MKVYLERRGRDALSWLIGTVAPVQKKSAADIRLLLEKTPNAKILFIRPHQGLGDLLLATPIFRALKNAYPDVELHFMADTYNAIAILNNKRLDRVWRWDKKKMQGPAFLRFIRALRAEHYTIAIPLSSHIPSFTSYLIARLSGAKAVLAFDSEPFYDGANWSRYLSHSVLPNRPSTDPEWIKFMSIVRPLLPSSPVNEDYTPEFEVLTEHETGAKEDWNALHLPVSPRKKVGLFFGGNPDRPERLWPSDYWGALAVLLQQNETIQLIAIVPPKDFLSGSRALERGIYGHIAPRLNPEPPLFANSDLSRVAAFLKGLDLFVCVDGGLFHIAVASKVRTLGLFFKTDPACWKPPVPWTRVLRPSDDMPTSLTADSVYGELLEFLTA